MPLPARRSDDADVIRARLRRLLADAQQTRGWVPDDDPAPTGSGYVRSRSDDAPYREGRTDAGDDRPAPHAAWEDAASGDEARRDEAWADDAWNDAAGGDAAWGGAAWREEAAAAGDDRADDAIPEPSPRPDGVGRHRRPGPTVRWNPGGPGARSLWLAGLAAALALLVWTWWDRPQVEPAPDPPPAATPALSAARTPAVAVGEAPETPPTVVVSVVGLVARPGLVTLPAGARVADAVEAAGGLLPEADAASINQAALVSDGEQIAVGVPGAPPAASGSEAGGSGGTGGVGGPVDLNTASVAELDALPGIGPVLAQRIVDHRTSVGPFASAEELDDVPGIGPAIAAELAALVTV